MPRLPIPGADAGQWGNVLNDFLSQSHTADGKLKTDSVTAAQLAPGAVQAATIGDGAITIAKLDISTKASLAKADSASQPGHEHGIADVTGLQAVLDNAAVATVEAVTAAAASATAAGKSAAAATAKADEAGVFAATADGSASAAGNSATAAGSSAAAATNKASEASASAAAASTSATNASASATAAAGSASTASTQADIATSAAGTLNAAAAAIAGAGTGIIAHTASGNNFTGRIITGTSGKVTVTNGDGVSGNPTITIPDSPSLVAPTLAAITSAPTYGSELAPTLAGWIGTGGATWSGSQWDIPSGGGISSTVVVVAGTTYQIELTRGSSTGGDMTVSLGSVTLVVTAAGNSKFALVAAESGSVAVSFTGATWVATATAVTVKAVTAWRSAAATMGGAEVRASSALGTIGIGQSAQLFLTTGSSSVAIGVSAQRGLATGSNNVGIGNSSQYSIIAGSSDIAIGSYAQYLLTTGSNNIGIGDRSQYNLTTAIDNVAIGYYSQNSLTDGSSNTSVGSSALRGLTTGRANTAEGYYSLRSLTTGTNNVGLGANAAYTPAGTQANATTTANYQTLIGMNTGQSSATQADRLTTIGYYAVGTTNATALGAGTSAGGTGSVAIGRDTAGNSATTSVNDEIKLGTANHTTNIPGKLIVQGAYIQAGAGAPEGVVTAVVGAEYHDTAVTNGVSTWVKVLGSGNTGWTPHQATVTTLKNFVTNGDFSNGTTGWLVSLGAQSVVSGELNLLASSRYGGSDSATFTATIGEVWYYAALIRADSGKTPTLKFYDGTGWVTVYALATGTSVYTSGIATIATTTASCRVRVQDDTASGWTTIYADNVMAVNLTTCFGAGNEPSKEQMDQYLDRAGWFSGATPLRQELWSRTMSPVLNNLITNGNFAYGTPGWSTTNASIMAASNEATVLVSAAGGYIAKGASAGIVVGHTYYVTASIKATSPAVAVGFGGNGKAHSGSGAYEALSLTKTATATTHAFAVTDNRASAWDSVYVKSVMVLDLTTIFGIGNEPSKQEMDAIIAKIGWFNGSYEVRHDIWSRNTAPLDLQGIGSPEGVVSAPVGSRFTDTAGTCGAWKWFKKSGVGNTGWAVEYGDTGWRRIQTPAGFPAAVFGQSGFDVRRVGDIVHARIYPNDVTQGFGFSAAIGKVKFADLPAGFSIISRTTTAIFNDNSITGYVLMRNAEAYITAVTTTGSPGFCVWTAMWAAIDTWPITLPGTAV